MAWPCKGAPEGCRQAIEGVRVTQPEKRLDHLVVECKVCRIMIQLRPDEAEMLDRVCRVAGALKGQMCVKLIDQQGRLLDECFLLPPG